MSEKKTGAVRTLELLYRLCTDPLGLRLSELSASFEVSERTIHRDLARLDAAGIPIYRDDGRLRIVDSTATAVLRRRMPPIGEDEVRILVVRRRLPDLARLLIPCLDFIKGIEPEGIEELIRCEISRLSGLRRKA